MLKKYKKINGISDYVADKELTANKYVLRCFTVSVVVFTIAYILNLLDVFIIRKQVMGYSFFGSLTVYITVMIITRFISLSNEKTKYFILFSVVLVYSIMEIFLTYHLVLLSVLPFLYAVLYSSKRVMHYTYILTVISTIFVVYGGYHWGLCDANMALLTSGRLIEYLSDGKFVLNQVNPNSGITLGLYYVLPRCLIYIVFSSICNSIFGVISGSLEKAQLTSELEKAKVAAEEANRAKSDFLARMSHEIRTPLNAVLGMNETILRESKEIETKRCAQDIKTSAKTLLSIINDVLDTAKIESGKMEIVPTEYTMDGMLNDIYNIIQVKAKAKNLKLEFEIDKSIPLGYFGDDIRIQQVLVNLLNNAVKYTEKGKVVLALSGKVEEEEAVLQFSIKDTGIGIREEDMEKLFSKFERLDTERNRHVEGTGIGMTIAVQLLHLMGSELKVESEYGKGSEFSFELVQKITNKEPLGDYRQRILQQAEEYQYELSYIAPEAKILIVDDNEINRKVLCNLLEEVKIQPYEAESGEESLTMVKERDYDIIFMDHMMPGMDGVEAFHAMKEDGLCEDTVVIMLTANAIGGSREKYLEEGFDDFLSKPIIPEELDKMILLYLPERLIKRVENEKEEIEVELPELEEFDFKYALEILQNREILQSTLVDFYSASAMSGKKLASLVNDIENPETLHRYQIEVHSLKSSSAIVGALILSKLARILEVATDENDIGRILTLHPILLDEIEKHRKRIEVILPKEEKQEIENVEEILALLDVLKGSLQQSDYDTADFVMDRMKQYAFSESLQQQADELAGYVLNLDTDGAEKVIDKMHKEMREGNV